MVSLCRDYLNAPVASCLDEDVIGSLKLSVARADGHLKHDHILEDETSDSSPDWRLIYGDTEGSSPRARD